MKSFNISPVIVAKSLLGPVSKILNYLAWMCYFQNNSKNLMQLGNDNLKPVTIFFLKRLLIISECGMFWLILI